MPHPGDPPGHLSVHRAFVVQLDTCTDITGGYLTGRVEHVVSGQATQFHSLETRYSLSMPHIWKKSMEKETR
jgi:hypothetical protein